MILCCMAVIAMQCPIRITPISEIIPLLLINSITPNLKISAPEALYS